MLKPGTRAPEFSLPDQDGNSVSLQETLAKGPVLLYFYPADFTPGCTKEACMIRDQHEEILDVGVTVLGISAQNEDSHARFQRKYDLPFTLLADTSKQVSRLYEAHGFLGMTKRITYLIGADGIIKDAVDAMFSIDAHENLINKALKTFAHGNRAASDS